MPSDEERVSQVRESLEETIFEYSGLPNNIFNRMKTKKKIENMLQRFYREGIIKPEGKKEERM